MLKQLSLELFSSPKLPEIVLGARQTQSSLAGVLLAWVLCIAIVASGNADNPDSSRLPVPTQNEIAQLKRSVDAIYGDAYRAARTAEQKTELAKSIYAQRGVAESATERYALIATALEIATEGNDPALVLTIVDEMAGTYRIEAGQLQRSALKRLSAPLTPQAWEPLAARLAKEAEQSIDQAQFTDAEEYAALFLMFGKRAKDQRVGSRVTALRKQVNDAKKSHLRYSTLVSEGTAADAPPQAKMALGIHLCVERDQWDKGLEFLAQGEDSPLTTLAQLELVAKQPDQKLELAAQWVAYAEGLPKTDREPFLQHAISILGQTIPLLTGLTKLEAEKQLDAAVKLTDGGTGNATTWVTIFRGNDAKAWNTNTNGPEAFAIPLATVPDTVRYVRIRRRSGEYVILSLTARELGLSVTKTRYGWQGTKREQYGIAALGIFDTSTNISRQRGQVEINPAGHTGWGFGVPWFETRNGMCWGGVACTPEPLEISVLSRELTKDERKYLLE